VESNDMRVDYSANGEVIQNSYRLCCQT